MTKTVLIDGVEYVPKNGPKAAKVSIWGMYDNHCFEQFKGKTVGEVVRKFIKHNAEPTMAYIGFKTKDSKPVNIGYCDLCGATVLDADEKELRKVGGWVAWEKYGETFIDAQARRKKELDAWKKALLADPDIPRLLEEGCYD